MIKYLANSSAIISILNLYTATHISLAAYLAAISLISINLLSESIKL
jgi:hypothetical protein